MFGWKGYAGFLLQVCLCCPLHLSFKIKAGKNSVCAKPLDINQIYYIYVYCFYSLFTYEVSVFEGISQVIYFKDVS